MKSSSKIGIIIVVVVLVLSLVGNIFQMRTNDIMYDQIDALKFQRDSIISNGIIQSKSREQIFKNTADSMIAYTSVYVKADSINHYKNNHEKAKIPFYTPIQRNHVYDSIYGTGGRIPNSTR